MNNETMLKIPAQSLPVKSHYDVAVVGGGIAGVSAAVAAAREGASVCLIEKQVGLGGLATLGIVTYWLPICDGRGRQVIGGIGEELLRLSVRDLKVQNKEAHFLDIPKCWEKGGNKEERRKSRFLTAFNPGLYGLALEEWVLDAGVQLMYDTRLSDVKRNRKGITHLVLENKSGRFAISVGAVVDASGDADVCYMAGEDTETSDANVAAGWFYYLKDGVACLRMASNGFNPQLDSSKLQCAHYDGTNGDDVTKQVIESHKLIRNACAALSEKNPDSNIEPFYLPSIPCFRATRRLVGEQSMTEGEMHKWFDDTVGLTGDWRRSGPVFAITMRMLRGVANNNLIAAGRCFSMDKTIWDGARCIPTCAISGEAAGMAAAIAVKNKGGNIHRLPIRAFQRQMRAKGNLLSEKLVKEVE